MRVIFLIVLIIVFNLTFGQVFNRKVETENILNYFLQQDTVCKIIFDHPWNIKNFHFDGDYSVEKMYPNVPDNVIICTVPIQFETAIYQVLKLIDASYDSIYYQRQIVDLKEPLWSSQNLTLRTKARFIKWRTRIFFSEINNFSTPLFSKDGQVAIIRFGSLKRNSSYKKQNKIFIFKKEKNIWELIATINSIKNW